MNRLEIHGESVVARGGYVTKYGIARPRVIENGISATKTSSVARINKYLKRPETLSWNI